MSWKKYFKGSNLPQNTSPVPGGFIANPGYRNFQSSLPEVYVGHPNRIERYNQYEQMDMDSEVNAALDILAEFSTQANTENGTSFQFYWKEKQKGFANAYFSASKLAISFLIQLVFYSLIFDKKKIFKNLGSLNGTIAYLLRLSAFDKNDNPRG